MGFFFFENLDADIIFVACRRRRRFVQGYVNSGRTCEFQIMDGCIFGTVQLKYLSIY